jgi:hypothetical protein
MVTIKPAGSSLLGRLGFKSPTGPTLARRTLKQFDVMQERTTISACGDCDGTEVGFRLGVSEPVIVECTSEPSCAFERATLLHPKRLTYIQTAEPFEARLPRSSSRNRSSDESRCAKIIPGYAFPSRNACNGGAETLFFMYKWSGSADQCGCFGSRPDPYCRVGSKKV